MFLRFQPTPEQEPDIEQLKSLWKRYCVEEEPPPTEDASDFPKWLRKHAPDLHRKYHIGVAGGISPRQTPIKKK